MKKLILFLILIFQLNECFAQCDSLPISVTIKVDKEYVKTYSKRSGRFADAIRRKIYVVKSDSIKEKQFDITLTLKNTSDTIISISLMTCSWEDNFIVNNKYIYLAGQECDNNFPTLVEFKPGESKVYTTTLIKSIKFDYPCDGCTGFPPVEATKLGLIIINDVFNRKPERMNYFLGMGDKSTWTIVWSNALYLLTESEAHPKPLEFSVHQKGQK
jgi:hypothetical protein